MKKTIIKFFDKIIISLLGFLGMFTSCKHESDCNARYFYDSFSPSDSLVVMYGVLHVDYEIKGKVTNKANAKPIANIRIIRQVNEKRGDTIYTNAEGKYLYRYLGYVPFEPDAVFYFKIEDIDGEENGGDFKTKEIEVKVTQSDQAERCENLGAERYEKAQNIKLERKK